MLNINYDNENARKLSLTTKDLSVLLLYAAVINRLVINCLVIKRPVIKAPRTLLTTL